MTTPTNDLGVIIMAGGKSERMGSNKALLRLEQDGPTLIELVAAIAQQLGPTLLVTNTPADYAFLNLPMVPDVASGGPLVGLYSGLQASPHDYNLVLACDMPRLSLPLLRHMAAQPRDYDVLIPRWHDASGEAQLETMHAIYSRATLPAIARKIESNRLRMISFHPDVRVRYLDAEELRHLDPTLSSFANLNTPADLQLYTPDPQGQP